jgi:hypothetical protein
MRFLWIAFGIGVLWCAWQAWNGPVTRVAVDHTAIEQPGQAAPTPPSPRSFAGSEAMAERQHQIIQHYSYKMGRQMLEAHPRYQNLHRFPSNYNYDDVQRSAR